MYTIGMRTTALLAILVILVGAFLLWYELVLVPAAQLVAVAGSTSGSTTTVSYYCDEGALQVGYGSSSVEVLFPNGSWEALPQVIAASGIRYEASSTVFWSKGENAFVTVDGTSTFNNCVAGAITTSGAMATYTDATKLFSFTYPSQFTLSGSTVGYSQNWMQGATTSGMLLVKVVVPASYQPHTNFAQSQFTVGVSADPSAVAGCLTQENVYAASSTGVSINDTPYTKLAYSGAAAGNRYDTTSYRTLRDGQCYAIEYTIHSLNIGNFPSGSGIEPFDQTAVQTMFDTMARSFRFLQ